MTYGFILNTIGVESITVTGEEDKFFEQTFDNLKDARKAAALATAALDSMRGTYSDCICDILSGVARDIAKVFDDGGTLEELRDKINAVITHEIEDERKDAASW